MHAPPKTQISSSMFVSILYSIVPTDDKNTDGNSTHKPNAVSQLTGTVRRRRSETANTVAGTTGSRYANDCQGINEEGIKRIRDGSVPESGT